jgi:hypothetical protein
MESARSEAVARQLDVLWTAGTLTGLSDAQLLGRFVGVGEQAAEPAFRELVIRLQPESRAIRPRRRDPPKPFRSEAHGAAPAR